MNQNKRKVSKGGALQVVAIIAFCLVILLLLKFDQDYKSTHYQQGTRIQGLKCSKLTVEEAKEKLEEREITLTFSNGATYRATSKELGAIIEDTSDLEAILTTQNEDKTQLEFILSEKSWYIDTVQVESFLKGIRELKKENLKQPKDAYLELVASGQVKIVSEIEGDYVNFKEACDFAVESLRRGARNINFAEITNVEPEIKATTLEGKVEELNRILGTKITFKLKNGETYTLSYDSAIKDWVKVKDGDINIDIDGNIRSFVESLNAKVQEAGKTLEFETAEGEKISVPVSVGDRNQVDIEAEINQIKSELESGEDTVRFPIYEHENIIDLQGDYVLVSLTDQWVRMYKNGELLIEGPCVTGTKGTKRATPTGLFYPEYKQEGKTFKTYGGYSRYWIPLKNGNGVGLHDAQWRSDTEFVPETYLTNGSHGCINMQLSIVRIIFENITTETPVLIY